MPYTSETKSLFFEILDRFTLFATEGRSGIFAATIGSEAWERILRAKKYKQVHVALYRLKEQKLLKLKKEGEQFILTLTRKGRVEALKHRIRNTTSVLLPKTICLVSFDFPEDIDWARDGWREFLKEVGFKQIHKSVWASRKDICGLMNELVKELRAERLVKVFKAKENED